MTPREEERVPEGKAINLRLTPADVADVEAIISADWATNQTDAIRWALRVARKALERGEVPA